MKTTPYKSHNLAHNSDAYQMLLIAQRTSRPEDYKKLDSHLYQVDTNYKKLHENQPKGNQ